MPRALLAGAFGQRNPGDDALLTAFADALPGWGLTAPAADPAAVRPHDSVTPVRNSAPRTLAALLGSDALVFGGGTVFKLLGANTGRRPHDLLLRGVALAEGARRLGKPVALVGVGAAALPDRAARRLTRRLAAAADVLVVRDAESADILADAGVPVPIRIGADAAWTLFPPARAETRPATGELVITTSRHGGTAGSIPLLAAAVARVVRDRPEIECVRLEPWQVGGPAPDDLDLARTLESALRVAGCETVQVSPPPVSVHAAAEGYRAAALVVGHRFHSLVAAAAAGTRFAAVAHEAKLAGLAHAFGQQALAVDAGTRALADGVHAALTGPAPAADEVARRQEAARSMLGLMRAVLEGGRDGPPAALHALTLRPEALIR